MIDWDRVDELRAEIGQKDFDEVVQIFLEEVDEALTDLQRKPPGAEKAEALHYLKGSALNLGFREVAAMCRGSESGHDPATVSEIAEAFHRARAVFLEQLEHGARMDGRVPGPLT